MPSGMPREPEPEEEALLAFLVADGQQVAEELPAGLDYAELDRLLAGVSGEEALEAALDSLDSQQQPLD